jgi:two-component system CheB/CheR fusion protein
LSPNSARLILIADDDQDARESLGAILELSGYEIVYAADGLEALSLSRTHRPDVVFLDIQMPGLDGYEVCRQMRAERTAFRAFALSGLSGADHDRACRESGFDGQLRKPVDPDVLAGLV